jgi:hypothetical protein
VDATGELGSWAKEEEAKDKRFDWPVRGGRDGLVDDQLERCDSGDPVAESKRGESRWSWISSGTTRTMVSLLLNALSSDRFCCAWMPNGSLAETEPLRCNMFVER